MKKIIIEIWIANVLVISQQFLSLLFRDFEPQYDGVFYFGCEFETFLMAYRVYQGGYSDAPWACWENSICISNICNRVRDQRTNCQYNIRDSSNRNWSTWYPFPGIIANFGNPCTCLCKMSCAIQNYLLVFYENTNLIWSKFCWN